MAVRGAPRRRASGKGADAAGRCQAALASAAVVLMVFSLGTNLLLLASPLYMLQVYDRVLTTGRVETLLVLSALMAAALLLFGGLDALRSRIAARMSTWLGLRLGPTLLEAGVRARLLGDAGGGQALRDLSQVQAFIASPGLGTLFDAPWTPVFLALIWVMHPWLGMVALGAALLLFALTLLNEAITRQATATSNQAQIAAHRQAEAAIRNAEVVRAMGMLPALTSRWRAANGTALMALQQTADRGGLVLGLTKSVRLIVQSATLGLGAFLVLRGEISGGAMLAASILLGRALAPLEGVMGNWRSFCLARIAWRQIRARLQALPAEGGRTRLPRPAGVVTFDNVSYTPPGSAAPVLQEISLRAEPGECIAVLGPSGGGKSTFCRLLVGIARPQSGEVRLDGSELHHWDPSELGRHIGYLPQDVELFSGTVRENIARMCDIEDEVVIRAAELAHAHDMIQRLPEGYETQIGDGGTRLSGGQRQRIGLARALCGRPRLIALDEPNANLDQAGEAALGAAIAEMKRRQCTVFIVGHRPSTMAQADRILMLRDGRVELFKEREEVMRRMRVAATRSAENARGSA